MAEIPASLVKQLRDATGAGMMECKAALQVAAANPQYVSRETVPADMIEREKGVYRGQMENSGKPPQVIEKIVEGKLGSFYEQVCLVDQASIRDPKQTVGAALQAAIAKLGENISVARFVRFKVGER